MPTLPVCAWLQLSCRDNHRISVQDPALAEQLWSATGLQHTMAGVTVDGLVPIGLNANIRFYRWAVRVLVLLAMPSSHGKYAHIDRQQGQNMPIPVSGCSGGCYCMSRNVS